MIVSQRGPGDAIDSDGYHGTLELDSKAVGRGKFKAEEVHFIFGQRFCLNVLTYCLDLVYNKLAH